MTYLPVDVTIDQKAKERHRIDTLNLLAYVSLLVLVLVTTWFFKRRRKLHLHETGLAIIYGLIMGALLRYFGVDIKISSEHLKSTIPMSAPADYVTIETSILSDKNPNMSHVYAYEFRGEIQPNAKLGSQISYASVDPEVFFNIILPPIVLNAGLSLKRRHFFRNIGAIFCYAFIGTTISVATVGSIIYGSIQAMKYWLNSTYLADRFSLANCLYFGAIISPTDPIAVLAIFQELGVDVNLFALVFGESILNDAVSIVLTHSIGHFNEVYQRSLYYSLLTIIWQCVHAFIVMFFESCLIGIAFGVITALTTKFTKLTESPLLESSLVVLMSYSAFLCAEVIDASGIVSILFCGITQAHYTINNLSFDARERLKNLFELLTFLCENFLFLAVGVCFWQRGQTWDLSFIGLAFAAITIARALSVYPLTVLLNLGRRKKIPMNYQHLIAWGGAARGVISYSLASRNTVGDARQIILSTTSVIVITTVIAVGGFVEKLLKCLRIPFGVIGADGKQPPHHHHHGHHLDDGGYLDDFHQASMSATNNPSWLVRPKRLRLYSGSAGSADHVVSSICSHRLAATHRAHAKRTNQLTGGGPHSCMSPDATPVLEIETISSLGGRRGHHWPGCCGGGGQQQHANSSFEQLVPGEHTPLPSSLAPLPESECSHDGGDGGGIEGAAAGSMMSSSGACPINNGATTSTGADSNRCQQLEDHVDPNNKDRSPYENASLVRMWRNLDNNFIKPLLTNSQPTLLDTMPSSLQPLARLFTSDEQLMR
uniref:Sodium/hydrogen exchanger n=1 Tax=Aceria tosichella TaxID=561515 RepID=A0A6G1SNF7_9ACAR